MSAEGHIVLTDFGMATNKARERTSTVAGTPEYFAPEMVKEEEYGVEVRSCEERSDELGIR